ncbi:hypothetical protein BKA66DRAFT_515344 [Pyrenochaeta sp. MPI-SDFR-AT-0127]|nr:hypothetical protein BKA66DRAFT_515344 [Pyrenochaeta sp. MPI-SDFR-AT-0127]
MNIEYPPQPPVLPVAHAADDPSNNGVFKLDDFVKPYQEEHTAQMLAREAGHASKNTPPPSKKIKTSENIAPLKPVAVGARSSKHTILLHEKYQALGILQPVFTYGGSSENGWTVQVSFPGVLVDRLQGLREEKSFNSKQEAKESISQKALQVLEELEREGKISKAGKARKKDGSVTQQQEVKEKEPGVNYIGQLLEYQRSISSAQPTYTDYGVGSRFACLLTIEGHTEPFGSLESLHSSKKGARQDAARHAIEYFQAQGLWPESFTSVGGIKKKKSPTSSTTPSTLASPNERNDNAIQPAPGNTSFAQQVAHLAATLSLPTPEWRYIPHPSDKDFHTVSCFFRNAGVHSGPIGEVRNIYGKKKAKEECARLTLAYLKDLRARRLDAGRLLMQGVSDGVSVVGGAVGRERDEEGACAKRQFVKEMGGQSEGEEFEDAVEGV